jgi:hypothetical protein
VSTAGRSVPDRALSAGSGLALRKVSVHASKGRGAQPRQPADLARVSGEKVPVRDKPPEALEAVARARLAGRLRGHQRTRVAECRCTRVAPDVTLVERASIQVDFDGVVSEVGGRLVFRGVKTCGSVHSCPMCAAAILRTRAAEVTQALDRCQRDRTAFCTFTLRHSREMALGALRKLLALSYSELKAGRTGAELKAALGFVGDVRAAEQTYGTENGWHPHLHAVWVFDSPPPVNFRELLVERWRVCVQNAHHRLREVVRYFVHGTGPVAKRRELMGETYKPGAMGTDSQRAFAVKMFGRRYVHEHCSLLEAAMQFGDELLTLGAPDDFLPDHDHGVHAELADDTREVAQYLAKLGLELTGIAKKTSKPGHFTSWDIGRRAADGDPHFVGLWKDHALAMLGARQLTWSRGLRAAVGLVEQRTDEELAAEESLEPTEIERLIGVVPGALWDQRVRHCGQDLVAELLEKYAARDTRSHELVTPRDGERDVTPRPDIASTWWERWREGAAALERGADRLPPPPRKRAVLVQGAGFMQRHADAIEDLREVLWLEHGIS